LIEDRVKNGGNGGVMSAHMSARLEQFYANEARDLERQLQALKVSQDGENNPMKFRK
jgi:hypothetical protein